MIEQLNIAAKEAEANRFLERIGVTTCLPPIHYEPWVIANVLQTGGDFEWVPEGLSLAKIVKLGTFLPFGFLKDPKLAGFATGGKWTIRKSLAEEQGSQPNQFVSVESVMMRNLMCRMPQDEHEWVRYLEVCYLVFLADFRNGGERPGNQVTVFPLRDGHPLDPKSYLPPWVMAFHGEASGGLDVRIFPTSKRVGHDQKAEPVSEGR